MMEVAPLRATDRDISSAIACVRAVYGEDYFLPKFYDPAFWHAFMGSGNGQVMAARDAAGRVCGLGMHQFEAWYPGGAFIEGVMVDPLSRHRGIGTLIVQALLAESEACGKTFVVTYPVLFHRFSQRLFFRRGFSPCGMFFNVYPASAAPAYAAGRERLHVGIAVRAQGRMRTHVVHVPRAARRLVEKVAASAGVPVRFPADAGDRREKGSAVGPHTRMAVTLYASFAQLIVEAVGGDVAERLMAIWHDPAFAAVVFAEAYVAVGAPSGLTACHLLQARGFRLAGYLPAAAGEDYLVFSLTTLPVDRATLALEPPFRDFPVS